MTAARARQSRPASRTEMWRRLVTRRLPLASLHALDAMERIDMVRAGVPAAVLEVIAAEMAITKEKLYSSIGVARATVERKIRARQRLNPDESERVLGIARLVGQVDQMVRESGLPAGFHAARWLGAWLDRPLPALGGTRPGTLMDTSDGRRIVAGILSQMQSGAYA